MALKYAHYYSSKSTLMLLSKPCLCTYNPSDCPHKDNGEIDASYFSWLASAGPTQGESMEELPTPAATSEEVATAAKEERIGLRLSAADKRTIETKAKRAGLSTGDYIRRAALGKTIVERVPPELRKQLGAAGNNLNQLARIANAGKLPGVGIEALNELVERLLKTLR
jgi:predicted DNA binding CopG/RHH family protein